MLGGLGSLGPMVIECYETIPAGISAKDRLGFQITSAFVLIYQLAVSQTTW